MNITDVDYYGISNTKLDIEEILHECILNKRNFLFDKIKLIYNGKTKFLDKIQNYI